MKKSCMGASFDEFLDEEGDREEIEALAMKDLIVEYLGDALREQGMSQSELARRMGTSPAAVHRLLDENDTSLTLATLARACVALGVSLGITRLRRLAHHEVDDEAAALPAAAVPA